MPGWTMFLERKIVGQLYGEATLQLHAACGFVSLKDAVARCVWGAAKGGRKHSESMGRCVGGRVRVRVQKEPMDVWGRRGG